MLHARQAPVNSTVHNGNPNIVATHDYLDECGQLLFQSVRREPGADGARKDFRQRRPDGKGDWTWNLQGVRLVPYHLPELLAADSDRPVFIPEGEKDVDNLLSIGLVATTNPMGAGKWRPEFNQYLSEREVVILPDNDDPGRKHAENVARQLAGVAKSVCIVPLPALPPKGDVSDWLAVPGNDRVKLLELVKAHVTLRRGDAYEPPDDREHSRNVGTVVSFGTPRLASELRAAETRRWLWHGLVAPGEITLLSALWKVGKTTLLAHLLRSLEHGESCCGRHVEKAKVLYITEESESRWAKRRDQLGIADHVTFLVRPFAGRPDSKQWSDFLDWLAELRQKNHFDLIVFDTLSSLWPVRDENDAAQVQAALQPLHRLTAHAALLLVHHLRKSDGQEGTASRGSGALLAFVDTILELRRFDAANRHDRRRVITGFARDDETPGEVVVELTEAGYIAHGDRQDVAGKELRGIIVGLLPNEPPGIDWEVVKEKWPEDTSPGKGRLLATLKDGAADGEWKQAGKGMKGSPLTFWCPGPG